MTTIDDAAGALGHLDMGFGYAVGADNYNPLPNATILLKFPVTSTQRPVGPVGALQQAMGHRRRQSHRARQRDRRRDARIPVRLRQQRQPGRGHGRRDRLLLARSPAGIVDGSLDVLVVGQVMTDLDAAGGGDIDGDDYEQMPKGNLDVTGRYFIWTTNLGGGRLDAFIVKIPAERLSPP